MNGRKAHCPICDGMVIIPEGTEESEILICPECHNRVVVLRISADTIVLDKAPEIEEDWGE